MYSSVLLGCNVLLGLISGGLQVPVMHFDRWLLDTYMTTQYNLNQKLTSAEQRTVDLIQCPSLNKSLWWLWVRLAPFQKRQSIIPQLPWGSERTATVQWFFAASAEDTGIDSHKSIEMLHIDLF